jgi:hypothetical protein
MPKYHVIHPVHTGKSRPHRRGEIITLSEKDGHTLTQSGHVAHVVETEADQVDASIELATLTKDQLILHAAGIGLVLAPALTKAVMIEQITGFTALADGATQKVAE